jgi:hypothetical protein
MDYYFHQIARANGAPAGRRVAGAGVRVIAPRRRGGAAPTSTRKES